jgi:phosphoribosylpyrophosphate synthetase
MRNLKTKVVEKIKTHILYSVTFFSSLENRAIYEIMWKNAVKPDNKAHACCALDTKDYRQQQ